jgi:hypothetical protein
MSNRKMKKSGLLALYSYPNSFSLSALTTAWASYAASLSLSSHNDAQLQARLLGLELVGATVQVVQHVPAPPCRIKPNKSTTEPINEVEKTNNCNNQKRDNHSGVRGVVTSATCDSVYIAVHNSNRVVRVERERSVLSLFLPFCERKAKKQRQPQQQQQQQQASTPCLGDTNETVPSATSSKELSEECASMEENSVGEDVGDDVNSAECREGIELAVGATLQPTNEVTEEIATKKAPAAGRVVVLFGKLFRPHQQSGGHGESAFVLSKYRHLHSAATPFTTPKMK